MASLRLGLHTLDTNRAEGAGLHHAKAALKVRGALASQTSGEIVKENTAPRSAPAVVLQQKEKIQSHVSAGTQTLIEGEAGPSPAPDLADLTAATPSADYYRILHEELEETLSEGLHANLAATITLKAAKEKLDDARRKKESLLEVLAEDGIEYEEPEDLSLPVRKIAS